MRATDSVVPTLNSRPMSNSPTLQQPAFSLWTTLSMQPCLAGNAVTAPLHIPEPSEPKTPTSGQIVSTVPLCFIPKGKTILLHWCFFLSKETAQKDCLYQQPSARPRVVPDDTGHHGETNTTRERGGKFQAEKMTRLHGKRKSRKGQDLWTSRANCKI